MKVIIDLMEAFSEHVGLPLLLVNVNGEIAHQVCSNDCRFSNQDSIYFLSELKNASLKQNRPTIMSVTNESYPSSLFYIITPNFKFEHCNFFIVAGPCLLETEKIEYNCEQLPLKMLKDDEIEEKLNKIRSLYFLLATKEEIETKVVMPEQVINMLQKVGNSTYNIFDNDYYIYSNLDEFLNMDGVDFIGMAIKNEDDIFVVKHINGINVQHLLGKKFFMGEGLLGNAVIVGKDFYWKKINNETRRAEFLNRYGIFPNHLFGFTLKNDKEVEGIVFGGSFNETLLSDNTLKIMKFIINYVYQKRQMKEKLIESEYIQSVFVNLLELIDIATYINDKKYISYKILDFCQTLNKGNFSCFTTFHDYFIFRGNMKNDIYEKHQYALKNIMYNHSSKVWIESQCIHFSLENYGLFTVEFDEKIDLQYAAYILKMIGKLFYYKSNLIYKEDVNEEALQQDIFHILFTSMKEMNLSQYDLTKLCLKFVNNVADELQLPNDRKKLMKNICKVLPYSVNYLEKYIIHTEEWKLLCDTKKFIQYQLYSNEYTIECQIVAFILKIIVEGAKIENIDFVSSELKDLFLKQYNLLFSTEHVEMDDKQIEEITDLRSVISTLMLTPREKEILYLILEGLNNHEVGQYLKISVHTVKNHVTNIFKKLNVSDRFQAMAKIYRIKYGES